LYSGQSVASFLPCSVALKTLSGICAMLRPMMLTQACAQAMRRTLSAVMRMPAPKLLAHMALPK
jgi:hypothetical protein